MSSVQLPQYSLYRPTPYNVTFAMLICVHHESISNMTTTTNTNKDGDDDDATHQQSFDPSMFWLYPSTCTNSTSKSSSNSSTEQDNTTAVAVVLRHAVDAFIQEQMLGVQQQQQQRPSSLQHQLSQPIYGSNHHPQHHDAIDSSSTILHGPDIGQFVQQFVRSISYFVQQQQHLEIRNTEQLSSTTNTTNLHQQQQQVHPIVQDIVTKLLIWLQVMTRSIDSFMDFFQLTLKYAVLTSNSDGSSTTTNVEASSASANQRRSMIDRSSMNGIFIRSLFLGYETLSFPQVIELWESMQQGVQNVPMFLDEIVVPNTVTSYFPLPKVSSQTQSKQWIQSSSQIDQTIRQYCYNPNLDVVVNTVHQDRANSTDSVRNMEMINPYTLQYYYPELPSAHFLHFMSSIRSRDRVQAQEALHEFVDATFIQSRYHTHQNVTSPNNNNTADILQYASILQAMMHTSFQEVHHLHHAIDEAIRVTQQQPPTPPTLQQQPSVPATTNAANTNNGANSSSNTVTTATLFAMAWLAIVQQYITNRHDEDNTYQNTSCNTSSTIVLLQRCIDQCRKICLDPKFNTTTQASLLSIHLMMGIHFVHASLTNSWISHDRAITFYTMDPSSKKKSSMNHTSPTTSKQLYDRTIHTVHLDNESIATNVLIPQKRIASMIYYAYQEITLSISTSIEILHYYLYRHPSTVTNDDMIVSAIRNVSILSSTMGSTLIGKKWIVEELQLGEDKLDTSSSSCIYEQAIRSYIILCDTYHVSIDNQINSSIRVDLFYLLHEWAVRRNDFDHANAIMTLLENYNTNQSLQTNDTSTMMMLHQRVLSLSRQGQYDTVKQMLHKTITQCKNAIGSGQQQQQYRDLTWALLQLCRTYILECNAKSNHQQYTNALEPLLECLSLSKQQTIDGLYTEGLLVLSNIHLFMGQYHRTSFILRMILPTLHRSHHVSVQAEAYLLLAKCRMKQASVCTNDDPKQIQRRYKLLHASIDELYRSRRLYERCHDCQQLQEVHYLLAHVYHHLSTLSKNGAVSDQKIKPNTPYGVFDYLSLRQLESSNYVLYTKYLSTTTNHNKTYMNTDHLKDNDDSTRISTSQFTSALLTRDGILKLANRSIPVLNTKEVI
jgi:Anaphase-promoting complex subunit 5